MYFPNSSVSFQHHGYPGLYAERLTITKSKQTPLDRTSYPLNQVLMG